jgi:glucan phosphorylase
MITTHDTSPRKIAYFSMEVGIGAQIPTYSGGLGVLAGKAHPQDREGKELIQRIFAFECVTKRHPHRLSTTV